MPERYKLRKKKLLVWQRALGLWSKLNKQMCDCTRSFRSRKKKPESNHRKYSDVWNDDGDADALAHMYSRQQQTFWRIWNFFSHWFGKMFWHFHPILCQMRRIVGQWARVGWFHSHRSTIVMPHISLVDLLKKSGHRSKQHHRSWVNHISCAFNWLPAFVSPVWWLIRLFECARMRESTIYFCTHKK